MIQWWLEDKVGFYENCYGKIEKNVVKNIELLYRYEFISPYL